MSTMRPWAGWILLEERRTLDGRMIERAAMTFRPKPMPLMVRPSIDDLADGHFGATVCGKIERTIYYPGIGVFGSGMTNLEPGMYAAGCDLDALTVVPGENPSEANIKAARLMALTVYHDSHSAWPEVQIIVGAGPAETRS